MVFDGCEVVSLVSQCLGASQRPRVAEEKLETGVTPENFETSEWKGGVRDEIPKGFESWSDYTRPLRLSFKGAFESRYALEGIKARM